MTLVSTTLTWTAMAAIINADNTFRAIARASVTAPGAMTTASVTLAGGTDPTTTNARFEFTTGGAGGLFYFGQDRTVAVTQVEGNFPGGAGSTVQVELVNLDAGLRPVTAESSTVFLSALPATADFSMSGGVLLLGRLRALRVTCAIAGKVWVTFRQQPNVSTY